MPTSERIARVKQILSWRQPDLRVVLDRVLIAHNASAVLRTCDAAGILYVNLISPNPDALVFNRAISTRVEKWLEISVFQTAEECLRPLKEKGFRIIATHLGPDSISYLEADYCQPTVLLFGNEAEGASPEALAWADQKIKIPMLGMVQSLNLSVSVGIILYEALRQRQAKGFMTKSRLSQEEYDRLFRQWLKLKNDELKE